MGQQPDTETLLQFPCDFPVKAMGLAAPDFEQLVIELVRAHAPDLREELVVRRYSSGDKYLSITLTIRATGKPQLDAIYEALSAHERVLMAL